MKFSKEKLTIDNIYKTDDLCGKLNAPKVKCYTYFSGIKVFFMQDFNWFHRLMIKLFFGLKIYKVGSDSNE